MERPLRKGAVVSLNFPFSDLSSQKKRPALVLAILGNNDLLVAQITSNAMADREAIEVTPSDFISGGLARVSYVRPGKLFAASSSLILEVKGQVKPVIYSRVVEAIVALIK